MAHFPPPNEVISHLFPPARPEVSHRYKGHRRDSWTTHDIDELVELRARQRTFDGAYIRTALGNFGYALLILKVFNKEFARIGLLYVILAVLLLLISYRRSRRSDHDFADIYRPLPPASTNATAPPSSRPASPSRLPSPSSPTPSPARSPSPAPELPANQRNWGRAFKTSGDVVVLVGIVCTVLYGAIFGLVMRL